jgi:hemolysin activation/secretion protein
MRSTKTRRPTGRRHAGSASWRRACAATAAIGTWLWVASPAAAQPSPPTGTVRVAGFQVSGNSLLPAAEVDKVLMPLLGLRSMPELQRAAAAVQALYAEAGYGAVVAYVPPQTGSDGIVRITVMEGKVAQVTVAGSRRYPEDRIKATLSDLVPGRTPRLDRIDTQLRMANENPARQMQLLLQPGKHSGEADARITVEDLPTQRTTVGLDNTGSDRNGEYRASLSWQHGNLSDRDDVASLQFQTSPTSPSQVKVLSAGYRLPMYSRHLVLDAFAAWSDVDGGTTPTFAGDLSFNGKGRIFGLRLAHYLRRWGEFDQRWAVGLDHRAYINRCTVAGLPEGACGPAGENVTVHPLTLDYSAQAGGRLSLGFNASLLANLRLGGKDAGPDAFAAVRPGASPGYMALRLGVVGGAQIADEWTMRGRITAQITGDALVPGEQFGLGGASSVRGYEEREVVGDTGAFASIEVGSPSLLPADSGRRLTLLAFADAGLVRNQNDAACLDDRNRCSLASLGLGARFGAGNLQARIDLAYPMKSAARTQRHDPRAHFAVNYGF